jgi:glucose/arabinose dehydrogenase
MNGKILRMNVDGTPAGNPFPTNPCVYPNGFRDPQGLAWDSSGQLYRFNDAFQRKQCYERCFLLCISFD